MTVRAVIEELEGDRVMAILDAVVQARAQVEGLRPAVTAEVRGGLAEAFAVDDGEGGEVTEVELARQALLVLAEDAETAAAIEALARHRPAGREQFVVLTTIAAVTAAIAVLQTRVQFERGADGRWTVKVDKKAASDSLLKALVDKLLRLAPQAG